MKKLEDIPKKNSFKVPDDYFENLESKIEERVINEKPVAKVSAFDIFKPYIYMAASVIILGYGIKAALVFFVDKSSPVIEVSDNKELEDYEDLISELSSDDLTLYEYLHEDTEQELASNTLIASDEDAEYVEDYLSQYYLEYELLNE